ncbi:MAG: hypothetical protein U0946_04395 [Patescibacteria group bacterium]|nr:hypothetical protein [Patescibacteria group bacterium]
MPTDFFKLLNIKPWQELGMQEEEMRKLTVSLLSFANLELEAKINKELGEAKLRELGEKGIKEGLKPEAAGVEMIESAYFAKTGNYFMEEMRQILNEYIGLTAKILKQVKGQVEAVVTKNPEKVKQLDEAIKNKDYDLAAKLTDELAKEENDG